MDSNFKVVTASDMMTKPSYKIIASSLADKEIFDISEQPHNFSVDQWKTAFTALASEIVNSNSQTYKGNVLNNFFDFDGTADVRFALTVDQISQRECYALQFVQAVFEKLVQTDNMEHVKECFAYFHVGNYPAEVLQMFFENFIENIEFADPQWCLYLIKQMLNYGLDLNKSLEHLEDTSKEKCEIVWKCLSALLKKAFFCVNHSYLPEKMRMMGSTDHKYVFSREEIKHEHKMLNYHIIIKELSAISWVIYSANEKLYANAN